MDSGVQVDVAFGAREVVDGATHFEVVGSGLDSSFLPPPELEEPSLNHQFIWKTPAPSS